MVHGRQGGWNQGAEDVNAQGTELKQARPYAAAINTRAQGKFPLAHAAAAAASLQLQLHIGCCLVEGARTQKLLGW